MPTNTTERKRPRGKMLPLAEMYRHDDRCEYCRGDLEHVADAHRHAVLDYMRNERIAQRLTWVRESQKMTGHLTYRPFEGLAAMMREAART